MLDVHPRRLAVKEEEVVEPMTDYKAIKTVEVPGDNSWTANQLFDLLSRIPPEAKIRTKIAIGTDPKIVVWWEEDV